jgi:hypothetical protein
MQSVSKSAGYSFIQPISNQSASNRLVSQSIANQPISKTEDEQFTEPIKSKSTD